MNMVESLCDEKEKLEEENELLKKTNYKQLQLINKLKQDLKEAEKELKYYANKKSYKNSNNSRWDFEKGEEHRIYDSSFNDIEETKRLKKFNFTAVIYHSGKRARNYFKRKESKK